MNDSIETWHLAPELDHTVREWFAGRVKKEELTGARSIKLAHPVHDHLFLKIKGAGLLGGPIKFGVPHITGPKAPIFDFDGRMMEDVASGHDGVFQGGASFQQVVTEWRISRLLTDAGYDVMPCAGYGRVRSGTMISWFSVFEQERSLEDGQIPPKLSLASFRALNQTCGSLTVELALKHRLIGYFWYVADDQGRFVIKDLHPFRQADPVNMSQLSWVMQIYFGLHILSNNTLAFVRRSGEPVPEDTQAWPFQAFLPDARAADHEPLRNALVAPYMLRPPATFDTQALHDILCGNRITAALMELCPEEFTRFQ